VPGWLLYHEAFSKSAARNTTNIIKSSIDLGLLFVVTLSPRFADSLSQQGGISLSRSLALFSASIEQYRM